MIQEAYVHGISARSVNELVQAMGCSGASKSEVSRLCTEIDERVHAFLGRPIEGEWFYSGSHRTSAKGTRCGWMRPEPVLGPAQPDPWVKAKRNGHLVSGAVIIAVAVNTDDSREVLGMTVGNSEAEPFWTELLRP